MLPVRHVEACGNGVAENGLGERANGRGALPPTACVPAQEWEWEWAPPFPLCAQWRHEWDTCNTHKRCHPPPSLTPCLSQRGHENQGPCTNPEACPLSSPPPDLGAHFWVCA